LSFGSAGLLVLALAASGPEAGESVQDPPAASRLVFTGPQPGESAEFDRCWAFAEQADRLAVSSPSLPKAELRQRLSQLLEETGVLETLRVAGRSLELPWLAQTRARVAEAPPQQLSRLATFSADRLYETCRLVAAGLQPMTPPELDRPKLVEILSRPEYRLRSRDETFLFRFFEWVRTWLRDLLSREEAQSAALSARSLFLVGLCVIAGLLAVKLARTRLGRRRRARETFDVPVVLEDPLSYEPGAARALAGGEGRDAMRLGLLMVLATLERLRLAAPGRAATNREVADQMARRGASPALERDTRQLVDWYDRAWYGLAEVPAEEASRFLDGARGLCETAQTRAREAS